MESSQDGEIPWICRQQRNNPRIVIGRGKHRIQNSLPSQIMRPKVVQKLSKKKREQPSFDEEGILSRIKESGTIDKDVVGRFRECVRVRHWVGHGRRWQKPLEVERLDPDDVYERVNALLQAVLA